MEACFCKIKLVVDSVAAIGAPVSSRDLIQRTVMGLGRDYDSLTTSITHFSGHLSFDDVREKLSIQEQILKSRHAQEQGFASHQPFLAHSPGVSPSPDSSFTLTSSRNSQHGGRGGGKGRGQHRGGRGEGAKQSQTHTLGGTVICNSVLSSKSVVVASPSCDTNHLSVGSPTVEGMFASSSSNIVRQICFHLGHSAVSCSSRYAQT